MSVPPRRRRIIIPRRLVAAGLAVLAIAILAIIAAVITHHGNPAPVTPVQVVTTSPSVTYVTVTPHVTIVTASPHVTVTTVTAGASAPSPLSLPCARCPDNDCESGHCCWLVAADSGRADHYTRVAQQLPPVSATVVNAAGVLPGMQQAKCGCCPGDPERLQMGERARTSALFGAGWNPKLLQMATNNNQLTNATLCCRFTIDYT
jgi:hypothetical protein